MLKITGLNRKVASEQLVTEEQTNVRLVISNHTCNAVLATDEKHNKGHFTLTQNEAEELDDLCQRIERRLAQDIAHPQVGNSAVLPRADSAQASAAVAAGSNTGV